jgi:uncharacterized protein
MPLTTTKGLSFPLRFGPLGHFERSSGADKINEQIQMLVLTSMGERAMNPDFGTLGVRAMFRNKTPSFISLMKQIINEAVAEHLPEISISDVSISDASDEGQLRVGINYRVITSSEFDSLEFLLEN